MRNSQLSWDTKKGPRIAFLGTGAQGASIAADFALAGLDVTFIDQWPDHIEAIRKNGITVNLPTRTINAKVNALHLCQVAEVKQPFDLVVLVVKAYDTKWATELIKSVLAPDGDRDRFQHVDAGCDQSAE
jgi:2-dehydropantoate 2-reductase